MGPTVVVAMVLYCFEWGRKAGDYVGSGSRIVFFCINSAWGVYLRWKTGDFPSEARAFFTGIVVLKIENSEQKEGTCE